MSTFTVFNMGTFLLAIIIGIKILFVVLSIKGTIDFNLTVPINLLLVVIAKSRMKRKNFTIFR